MGLGAALVLAALSLFVWNGWEDRAAGACVESVLPQLRRKIQAPLTPPTGQSPPTASSAGEVTFPDPYDPTMTEVEIDGYAYIGYLSIPSVELELPVMSQWDDARLKIAPCRYTGSTKTDNLVLCAHNYDRHFWPIRNLAPGDAVYFTDMDGMVWQYEVVEVDILAPSDVEGMTAGEYELTLFTCTYGGQSRVTVRCADWNE